MIRSPTVAFPRARRLGLAFSAVVLSLLVGPASALAAPGTYRNPLEPTTTIGDGIVESCADPSVIYAHEGPGAGWWYMYCTADPLNDGDRTGDNYNFRLIPTLRSRDLVNWTYVNDAFGSRPGYATPGAGLWAPEIEYFDELNLWRLYYTVTETNLPGGGSAIGVATSTSPTGPWTHSQTPVVEPHGADCCGPNSRRNVFDPEVIQTDEGGPQGTNYIYYGSYFGGVSVRVLSEDGLTSDPATQENVGIANKFEGPEVIERNGWYYLFMSATDCCRGPLTGYLVMVGRSQDPTGPFRDRSNVDLNDNEDPADPTDGRAGGSAVIVGNDNPWVGPGHNTVFQDFAGQWWTIYHAIDRNEPYFEDAVDIFEGNCGAEGQDSQPCGDLNKRPALLDALDWTRDGWPVLNGGAGISTTPQHAPAAQPGQKTNHRPANVRAEQPSVALRNLSDDFNGSALASRWTWTKGQPSGTTVSGGLLRTPVQNADLYVTNNSASVLVENAPNGNFMVETKVRMSVPAEGCCPNYAQAGVVIHRNDDNYMKLVEVSIWNTRQTEWAKELAPVPDGYPRYGNSIVGPPGGFEEDGVITSSPLDEWTYLRIVRRINGGKEHYTAYTRAENGVWEKGMTWVHALGKSPRIGLVAMGGGGNHFAEFDYVRVSRLHR